MDKLHRSESRQVWRCVVCQFDNSILLENCEMCDSKKPQVFKAIIKEQKVQEPPATIPRHLTLTCLDSKCKTQNDINEIKCKKCAKFLISDLGNEEDGEEDQFEEAIKEIKVQTVPCHKCSFQNDLANINCVNCDSKMKKKRLPKIPKVRAPRKRPNFCQKCNSYKIFVMLGSQLECKCPDPEDLLPVLKMVCNYCFQDLKEGQYDSHVATCKQRQTFYDRTKNKSFDRCTTLQIDTMIYMQKKCEKLHFEKQRKLQKRIEKLGYNKKDLQNLYYYIVNYAPIIIHMHANTHFQFFVKDTHYRSQFETSKSSGSLSRSSRTAWEDRMFDKMHHHASDYQRVKYGTMNFTNDPHGVAVCTSYGQSYFLLKEHVRDRCTMTDMDSSSPSSTICTFRFCYHLLCKLSDNQIKAAFEGSKAQEVKSAGIIGAYKQIQIHGPVEFKNDIQRVYIHKAEVALNPNCIKQVQQFCKKTGLDYELFGQVPKPVAPIASFGFGSPHIDPAMFAAGGVMYGASSVYGGSAMFGGSIFGGPAIKAPIYKPPPIKYTSVSFPYSSKPKKQDSEQEDDYI